MTDAELVLFDLDGTLVDTAPDMAAALNELLVDEGRPPLPFDRIRPHVSHGATGLLRLGFGASLDAAEVERLRSAFLERYQESLARESRLCPGVGALLDRLEHAGVDWGVVTNKPGWLTAPLLRALALDRRTATVVSGDTLEQRKPDPAPLLFACSSTGHAPEHAAYVGDAERDVVAGTAAGMPTYVALYGYLGDDDAPETWGAAALLDTPMDLWPHLRRRAGRPEAS